MKAEEILLANSDKGHHSHEAIILSMKEYAKDQIEKDRVKLMNELTLCDWQVKMVNETPIILD